MNIPLSMSLHWLENTYIAFIFIVFGSEVFIFPIEKMMEKRIKRVKPGLCMLSRLGRDSYLTSGLVYAFMVLLNIILAEINE